MTKTTKPILTKDQISKIHSDLQNIMAVRAAARSLQCGRIPVNASNFSNEQKIEIVNQLMRLK